VAEETGSVRTYPNEPRRAATTASVEDSKAVPGIFEIQNRGRGYRTFNFTSPIDDSAFSFSSWAEAKKTRQSMMKAFEQQARFDGCVRQKTGKKPEDDELDE
jgi:hypothetical protein